MGVCSRCHEKYMTVIAARDAARAALAIETTNANALAHERDALRAEVERLRHAIRDAHAHRFSAGACIDLLNRAALNPSKDGAK